MAFTVTELTVAVFDQSFFETLGDYFYTMTSVNSIKLTFQQYTMPLMFHLLKLGPIFPLLFWAIQRGRILRFFKSYLVKSYLARKVKTWKATLRICVNNVIYSAVNEKQCFEKLLLPKLFGHFISEKQ